MQNEQIHTPLKPAIGESDFKGLVTANPSTHKRALYIDKTLMIRDILEEDSKFLLFTRPRRFGKTLNMSMLKHFFHEKSDIFNNLKIANCPNILENFQGSRTTIFITLKDVKGQSFGEIKQNLAFAIEKAFFSYHDLFAVEFNKLVLNEDTKNTANVTLTNCIYKLSEKIFEKTGKQVVILCDEYDTPLNEAYVRGFLPQALPLIRDFFSNTFKDNNYIYKGIITGINRIAKESLFSSLNNLKPFDISEKRFSEYFGFTESEINSLSLSFEQKEEMREWYNGYNFGGTTIYNPWSVLNYISSDFKIKRYWSNSGGTNLIEESISMDLVPRISALINGEAIQVGLEEDLIFSEIKTNKEAFFNLLYNAGYVTLAETSSYIQSTSKIWLRIVNKELVEEMKRVFARWFTKRGHETFLSDLINDFVEGNINNLQQKLSEIALRVFSFHDLREDYQESFYHGFLLGISIGAQDRFIVKSNRESGHGRYDIAWYPNHESGSRIKDPGVVIELKVDKLSAEEALNQINVKHYDTDLIQYGCDKILKYGIHFNGKKLKIVKA